MSERGFIRVNTERTEEQKRLHRVQDYIRTRAIASRIDDPYVLGFLIPATARRIDDVYHTLEQVWDVNKHQEYNSIADAQSEADRKLGVIFMQEFVENRKMYNAAKQAEIKSAILNIFPQWLTFLVYKLK